MHLGYDHYLPHWRVTAILAPRGAAGKRLRAEAAREGRLLDATSGRKTRSLVITDAHQVVLSAVAPETLMARLETARRRDGKVGV